MAMLDKYDVTRLAVDDANRMVDDVNRREVSGFVLLEFSTHVAIGLMYTHLGMAEMD